MPIPKAMSNRERDKMNRKQIRMAKHDHTGELRRMRSLLLDFSLVTGDTLIRKNVSRIMDKSRQHGASIKRCKEELGAYLTAVGADVARIEQEHNAITIDDLARINYR